MARDGEQEQLIEDGGSSEPAVGDGSTTAGDAMSDVAGATATAVAIGDVVVEPAGSGDLGTRDPYELSKETLLPVTGMVRLSPRELEIIDHPAFQRLFEIYQLGQTHLVYRGATHMRGEHAIGSVHTMMVMVEATKRNRARGNLQRSEHWQRGEALSDEEVAFARLGALLHDIGHLPAGHTLEDELGLLARHDGDERINLILDRTEWHGRTYASLRSLIDEKYADEATKAMQVDAEGKRLTASELLTLLISSDHTDANTSDGTDFRVGVCRDLIGNTICADLLDYLHRDWLYLGKPRFFDPRILDYLEIVTRERRGIGREDRLVINLKGTPRPRPDAVTGILDLLDSRYQLSEIALFHRVKLAAAGMLERVIAEYRDSFPSTRAQRDALRELTPELLESSDAEMLKLFERKLLGRRQKASPERVDGAVDLVRRLRVRKLHRDLHILYEDDVGGPERAALISARFSGDPSVTREKARAELQRAADDRLKAVRTLERDFGLRPGDVVMYCPSLQMNTKIADVGIFVKGMVDSLAALDERNHLISGGHLSAQQERFRRLWRISFAIDEDAYERLKSAEMLDDVIAAIEAAVLWTPTDYDTTAHDAVRRIAQHVTKLSGSPWYGCPVVDPALNRDEPNIDYPGGAPSISSFIGQPKATATNTRRD